MCSYVRQGNGLVVGYMMIVCETGRICKPKPSCKVRGPSGCFLSRLVLGDLEIKMRNGRTHSRPSGCSKFPSVHAPFLCGWNIARVTKGAQSTHNPAVTSSLHSLPSSRASNTIKISNGNT